jgi:hypothetical protein
MTIRALLASFMLAAFAAVPAGAAEPYPNRGGLARP